MTTRTADTPAQKVEIYGAKGMKSTPFRKTFNSQSALEKWMDSPAAENVSVYGTRAAEGAE